MVKKIIKKGKEYFQCEKCLFLYKNKEFAGKCESYCKKRNSCNLEIIKHSIKIQGN
jgi:hypothetical protein